MFSGLLVSVVNVPLMVPAVADPKGMKLKVVTAKSRAVSVTLIKVDSLNMSCSSFSEFLRLNYVVTWFSRFL